MTCNAEMRRTQSSCHDDVVVEWAGKPERGISTRRRGDAEEDAENAWQRWAGDWFLEE